MVLPTNTIPGGSELYYGRSDPLKSVPRFVSGRPFKWHRGAKMRSHMCALAQSSTFNCNQCHIFPYGEHILRSTWYVNILNSCCFERGDPSKGENSGDGSYMVCREPNPKFSISKAPLKLSKNVVRCTSMLKLTGPSHPLWSEQGLVAIYATFMHPTYDWFLFMKSWRQGLMI